MSTDGGKYSLPSNENITERMSSSVLLDEIRQLREENLRLQTVLQRLRKEGTPAGYQPLAFPREQLEESLLKSKSQQQTILDNIPHLAWLKDTDFRYISANKAFCRFFNLSTEEISGKTDFDLVPEDFAQDYHRKDMEVVARKNPRVFYEIEEGKFGKRYSETFKSPVLNDAGEVIGIAGISRDITEQKLAEQALQRSEEKYKTLITLLPEMVFETDFAGRLIFLNRKAYEVLQYTQHDLEDGVSFFDLFVPEEIDRLSDDFHKLSGGQVVKDNEYTLLTKNGNRIPVLSFAGRLSQNGRFTGIRGVIVDISQRKKLEQNEKEYQKKLIFLSESALGFLELTGSSDIYSYIGEKLSEFVRDTCILVNRFDEATQCLHLHFSNCSAEVVSDLENLIKIHPSKMLFKLREDQIRHMMEHAEHVYHFRDGFYETSFGQVPRPVALQMERILQAGKIYGIALMRAGKLYGNILVILKSGELTDQAFIETFAYQASIALHRRQLEAELIGARVKAEESDKLKTAFLANMSHEIRTPMNGILGLTQLLLQNEITGADRREYLTMINANGKILLELVNDILDISKIESNQLDITEEAFQLKALMNDLECFILAEKMIHNLEKVELKTAGLDYAKDLMIMGDRGKIRQVFVNLIGNAIKFTPKGQILFGLEEIRDQMLVFFVKDTGIGIPPDKLEVIFNRFTQVDQSLTRPYGGSGLGLAICKGFVERMGGSIYAASKAGEGSVFRFEVPYRPLLPSKDSKDTILTTFESVNWKDITLLIVEDNLVSYKLLEASLKRTGITILHARDGIEAIRMVKEHPAIRLVLMDIQLPVMNGYDSTREIKKLRPELPVIAQTANAMDEDRLRCLNAGCSDYITKPIILEKLLTIANEYLTD
jgi:PAS domain S-box-containing protein